MSLPAAYVALFPIISKAANECGYALGLHGSFNRDFDIMAMPWVDEAVEAKELIQRITNAITFLKVDVMMDDFTEDKPKFRGRIDGPERKPHGRQAWNIHLGGGKTLDISVMPRTKSQGEREAIREEKVFRDKEIYRHFMYVNMSTEDLAKKYKLKESRIKGIVDTESLARRKRDRKEGLYHILPHPLKARVGPNRQCSYVVAGPFQREVELAKNPGLTLRDAQIKADDLNEQLKKDKPKT